MAEFPIGQLISEITSSVRGQNSTLYVKKGEDWVPFDVDNVTLKVKPIQRRVVEQLTEQNANNSTLTFSAPLEEIEIHNTDETTGTFRVNGITLTVPAKSKFRAEIGGSPSPIVSVTGSTSYIITRYSY